jgi:BlaI family transcriptional regulator, penicillinase repressor
MRSSKPGSNRKPLSELETKLMRFLWAAGPVSSEQVREGLTREHPMKEATVRTVLRRLEEKGYVTHEVEGRTFIYRGLERPEHVAVQAIRQLLDRFCGGSMEQLLVGMVDQKMISPQELNALAKKIAQRRKKD